MKHFYKRLLAIGIGGFTGISCLAYLDHEHKIRERAYQDFMRIKLTQDTHYRTHFLGDRLVSDSVFSQPRRASTFDYVFTQFKDHDNDGDTDMLVTVPRKGVYLLENLTIDEASKRFRLI